MMFLVALLTALVVISLFYFLNKTDKSYWLILLAIPTALLIFSSDTNVMSNGIFSTLVADVLFFVASVILVVFPLSFTFKNLRSDFSLLLFISLLIEWDWIVTWRFLQNYSFTEINTLLNISSFSVFTFQKLAPIFLFVILYWIARPDKKLMKFLDYALILVAAGYYFVFLWQLYVISFVHIETRVFGIVSVMLSVPVFVFLLKNRLSRCS